MVTRRVSEELLTATKSSLTRRVTSSSLRFEAEVSAVANARGSLQLQNVDTLFATDLVKFNCLACHRRVG